jgi:hypothetical protein
VNVLTHERPFSSLVDFIQISLIQGASVRAWCLFVLAWCMPKHVYAPTDALKLAEVSLYFGLPGVAYAFTGYALRYMHPQGDEYLRARALHLVSSERWTLFPKRNGYQMSVDAIYRDLCRQCSIFERGNKIGRDRQVIARVNLAIATHELTKMLFEQDINYWEPETLARAKCEVRRRIEKGSAVLAREGEGAHAFALQVYLSSRARRRLLKK